MQAVKNGIKCTLRTPGKAALFTMILTVLSALIAVSFCGFFAVRGYLADANEYFHTVALMEFMGEMYPDRNLYDQNMADALAAGADELDALARDPAVIAYEPDLPCLAQIDGMVRRDENVFNADVAVLGLYITAGGSEIGECEAIVGREYFSARKMEGKLVHLVFENALPKGAVVEAGKTYVMAGRYAFGATPTMDFRQSSITFEDRRGEAVAGAPVRITDYALDEDDPFRRLADVLDIQNNACRVTYTDSLTDLPAFHQQDLKLASGRFFTEEEYASGAHKAIISEKIAGTLGLKKGDTLSMRVFGSAYSVYSVASLEELDSGEYEIVGTFTDSDAYPCWVFLPGIKEDAPRGIAGYSVGSFRLKNEGAADFLKRAQSLGSAGFRMTLLDQGYSEATEPMRELLLIAAISLAASLLLAAAALALQGHVFVSRQREAASAMMGLGSGKAHVAAYFLSSALLLSLAAAVIGCFGARLVESRVMGLMRDIAARYAEQDVRFSVSRLAVIRTLEFLPRVPFAVYAAAGAALIAGSAITTLLFVRAALREPKKRKRSAEKPARIRNVKSSKLSGVLKYACLSIRRGRTRTAAAIALAAAAALFFVRITVSIDGYRGQLDAYISSSEIFCYASNLTGRSMDRLLIKPECISGMMRTGIVSDCCVTSFKGYCTLAGVVRSDDFAGGLEIDAPENRVGALSAAIFINRDRPIVSTSYIENCPQFRYGSPEMTWLEGYCEEDFLSPAPICALSETTMKTNGIELGDRVAFTFSTYSMGEQVIGTVILRAVASYSAPSSAKTVFIPLRAEGMHAGNPLEVYNNGMREAELWKNEEHDPRERLVELIENDFTAYEGEMEYEYVDEYGETQVITMPYERPETKLSSFTFRLKEAARLDVLRGALQDNGFTWVRSGDRIHNYAVIEDEIYLNTVHSMERQIEYVSALYYSLCALVGAIGFILAWLLTSSRRREIALMRAIGARKGRILLNFLFEQAALAAAGLCAGLALGAALGTVKPLAAELSAAFFAVWCVSAFICLAAGFAKKSHEALTEPE